MKKTTDGAVTSDGACLCSEVENDRIQKFTILGDQTSEKCYQFNKFFTMQPAISIKGLNKFYGKLQVLDN